MVYKYIGYFEHNSETVYSEDLNKLLYWKNEDLSSIFWTINNDGHTTSALTEIVMTLKVLVKGTLAWDFYKKPVWPKNLSGLQMNYLKYFHFWLQIHPDI